MSTIQTAAANTVLRIANLFEQNCALKHGLPKFSGPDRVADEPISTSENVTISRTETTTDSTVTESPSPGVGAAVSSQSSLMRRAAPYFLGAAVAGVPAWMIASKSTTPAVEPQPQPQAVESIKDGDLLQWLQSQGKHLPEGTWPTPK